MTVTGLADSHTQLQHQVTSRLGQRIEIDFKGELTHDIMHDITCDIKLEVLSK